MLKKRLILTLLLQEGVYMNSTNFNLQAVGNLETIEQYLNFEAIDELVILNVSRNEKDLKAFCEDLKEISKQCFVPICAGGGVRSTSDFEVLLKSGADKIIINSAALEDPQLITHAAKVYGSQCVVVSIDTKKNDRGVYEVHSHNGTRNTQREVLKWAEQAQSLGAGEIYLTSIERDGRGQGYDLELVKMVSEKLTIPVIASGGVSQFPHLVEGIKEGHASAVSAANIFHFIGEGLKKAKEYLETHGLDFPHTLWNF